MTLYDEIGTAYTGTRVPDPRIASAIEHALGDATTVLNVGAGTGSYEPLGRRVVAVEPSEVMLGQRRSEAAPAVQARAEALPFARNTFDAVLGVLTVHHWTDQRAGLLECGRVARHRVVILTWDPMTAGFWLGREYFPELLAHDQRMFPRLEVFSEAFAAMEVVPLLIPAECTDGFLGAFWQRPAAYLDPRVRAGMSSFARVPDAAPALTQLEADVASGAWEARHGALRERAVLDVGYRLVIGTPASALSPKRRAR
ncbi:class I SAM-dependent methyltransferase [soil metagenome]